MASSETLHHYLPVDRLAEENRPWRVMVLDPAGSSAHISHNLCNHLSALGCDVHVFHGAPLAACH